MNPIYHALSKYKNWQPHIHLATVETKLSFGGAYGAPYVIYSILTFYADSFFKKCKIQTVEVHREKYGWANHHDDPMRLLREKRHKEMLQFLRDIQSLPECRPADDSLLVEAKECLLLDNPPRTGLFLVKLIEDWEKKKD